MSTSASESMESFDAIASAYFEQQFGLSLPALLAPVDMAEPAGSSLRGGSVYSAIEQARRQDDASLPMGHWEYELKRADWKQASTLCVQALATQSKDLQLAAWLLEAQINQSGFQGIAPCLCLLHKLCHSFWPNLYPRPDDGDLEYRANIFRWLNEKLLPALRLVPITACGRQREYSWSDLELARRNEQASSGKKQPEAPGDGLGIHELNSAISATSLDAYTWLQRCVSNAVGAIEALSQELDRLFGDESPSLAAMAGLLQQILAVVEAELYKRGVRIGVHSASAPISAPPAQVLAAGSSAAQALAAQSELALGHATGFQAIRDRADAYARLAETAEYLMQLEPHSPVPYLVRRATEWGRLNTVELYQELFLKLGGQLNIFEMLGLEAQVENGAS